MKGSERVDYSANGRSTRAGPYLLASAEETLIASDYVRSWSTPLTGGLPEQVHDALQAGGSTGGRLVVGAIPFDPQRPSLLLEPAQVVRDAPFAEVPAGTWADAWAPAVRATCWSVTAEPSVAGYEEMVEEVLRRIRGGSSPNDLRKVVLSRSLLFRTATPVDLGALIERLRLDRSVTVFAVPLPSDHGTPATLVGATPELLLSKSGAKVVSEPLAGSISRRDMANGTATSALFGSDKDRREHALVVEHIADMLAPHCRRLYVPPEPSLVSTSTMWHLGTRIEGELRDDSIPSLELLVGLHPTPAVCGMPSQEAARVIGEIEPFERDFYGGAIGWCDDRGDGRWHIALRCARVTDDSVRLYAGAGIVHGSNPAAEAAETSAKFTAMLRALGLDENGASLPG